MVSGLPFDDLRNLLRTLPDVARPAATVAGTGGRIGAITDWLASATGRAPRVTRPVVALFAGTHGVVGDDKAPANLAVRAFVERCSAGRAGINEACAAADLGLKVFDLALDVPVADITRDAALDERGAAATIAFGMEAIAGGADLLVLGGYGGEGGAIAAAAVLAALHGETILGNADTDNRAHTAIDLHAGHLRDPLEALRRVGGREIAALVGAIVAARTERVAVILAGEAALAAASVVATLEPRAIVHCMVADRGSSPLADAAADKLGLKSILDIGLSGGDGAAGAIAAGLVKTATLVLAADAVGG